MSIELFLVTVTKALVELTALFIVGQGALHLLAGAKREGNFAYELFRVLTRPVYAVTRRITPRVIIDRHIPLVALVLLAWLWIVLLVVKAYLCGPDNPACVG